MELPKCFNCHAKLDIIDEELPNASTTTTFGHPGGIMIINPAGQELINYSEALTHIFELDPGGIEEVELLNVNDIALCDCCYEILVNIYSLRQNFQDLTDPHSCIFKLLNKPQWQPPNEDETKVSQKYSAFENDENQLMDIDREEQVLRIPEKRLRVHNNRTHGSEEEEDLLPGKISCKEHHLSRSGLKEVHEKTATHQRTRTRREGRLRRRRPPRKAACPECGETVTALRLRRHMKDVHKMKNFKLRISCDICARPCESADRLKLHRFSHLSEAERMDLPPEDLQNLERDQATLARYARRKREEHISRRRPVKCPECTAVLSSPYTLRNHIKLVHRCQSKHVCDICGKPTITEYALKSHRVTHFGSAEKLSMVGSTERPLCPICGASFKDQGALKSHITRVHEKSTPTYTCEKCGYKVRTKKCFNIHLRTHEIQEGDEYFYSCEKCPMKFKFKGEKRLHVLSCPGEAAHRPFPCIIEGCDRRFKYRHVLELHINEFHKYGPEKAREMLYPEGIPKGFKAKVKYVSQKWERKNRVQKSADHIRTVS